MLQTRVGRGAGRTCQPDEASGEAQLSRGKEQSVLPLHLHFQTCSLLFADDLQITLDMGVQMLERWLSGYRGTVTIRIHDITPLDRVCNNKITGAGGGKIPLLAALLNWSLQKNRRRKFPTV